MAAMGAILSVVNGEFVLGMNSARKEEVFVFEKTGDRRESAFGFTIRYDGPKPDGLDPARVVQTFSFKKGGLSQGGTLRPFKNYRFGSPEFESSAFKWNSSTFLLESVSPVTVRAATWPLPDALLGKWKLADGDAMLGAEIEFSTDGFKTASKAAGAWKIDRETLILSERGKAAGYSLDIFYGGLMRVLNSPPPPRGEPAAGWYQKQSVIAEMKNGSN